MQTVWCRVFEERARVGAFTAKFQSGVCCVGKECGLYVSLHNNKTLDPLLSSKEARRRQLNDERANIEHWAQCCALWQIEELMTA